MAVHVTTLGNGLRVASHTMDTVETVSLGVWVQAGTRNEPEGINGISHLLEHMAFKGTEKRSALAIAQEVEDVGGHLNAYTSREITAYYAKVLKEDSPLAVDIISDILQHSVFDPEELERERSVVLQEISQAVDTPDDIIFDHFQATAFPAQALGRPVLGSVETVGALSRDDLKTYMGETYSAPNMVLAAAGNLDHDRLVEMASEAFTDLPAKKENDREPASYTGGDFREGRDLEQVHLLLGFEGVKYHDPDFYGLSVLSSVLGGGMSSRLFQEVREKRGLVYSIYSYASSYDDGGLFGVYAGTGPDKVEELIPVVCGELIKATDTIGEEELARARAQFKASLLMSLESTTSRCEQLARHLMVYDRPLSMEELVAKIEAVTVRDLQRLAAKLLTANPTFAALGPVDRVAAFGAIKDGLAA